MPVASQLNFITLVTTGFIINVIELGTFKSFGVLLLSMADSLEATNAALGFTISLCMSIGYIFGPFIITSLRVIGERYTMIIAGIMCSVGLVAAAFATETWMLVISLTVVGCGNGIVSIASYLIVATHVSAEVKATAIGVFSSGGAFGIMIFPPFAEYLQELYGWRGVLLIFGAISANVIVCGAIMTSPNMPKIVYQAVDEYEEEINNSNETSEPFSNEKSILTCIKRTLASLFEPFSIIKETPIFTAFIMARFLSGMVYTGWTIFLMPHSILKGIPPLQSALLSSMGGIGAIVGRLTPGPIIDNGYVSALQFGFIANSVNTIAYLLDPLANSFWSLSILAVINGFVFGSELVIVLPICEEMLQDDDKAISAFGIAFIPVSVGILLGGVLMGYFFDIEVGWFTFLTSISAGCAMMFAIPLIVYKYSGRRNMEESRSCQTDASR